jgi:DNA polymerase-3 subunit delta
LKRLKVLVALSEQRYHCATLFLITKMKLNGENLPAQLRKELPSICLVTGDEPLLLGEACDQLRAAARDKGFTERQVFFVERGFDWNELRAATQAMSLFAEQRILEVRLEGASPGNDGSEVLCDIAAQGASDILLLVITNKLDARSLSTKWVTAVEKQGWLVQVWPVELAQLPSWIERRLQRANLKSEPGVAALLAERVEGNLLAAQQEIDKLALLYPDQLITADIVTSDVADSARYDVLQLGMAAMQGHAARALRILDGLHEEGIDATLVLWGINKDVQWMARVAAAMTRGQSADAAMQGAGVWRPRQAAMKQAVQRLKLSALRGLIYDAAQVDAAIKGVNRRDPWVELRGLVARMSGTRLARAKVA